MGLGSICDRASVWIAKIVRFFSMLTIIMSPGLFLAVSLLAITVGSVRADPKCQISHEKREMIVAGLCGQFAPESEYRFSGPNCAAASIRKRLDDSAIQIHAIRLCGDVEFSEQLKVATIKAINFMEILSVCTGEKLDLKLVMNEAMSDIGRRMASVQCDSSLRASLSQKRAYFENMIKMSSDPNFQDAVYSKMGVRVDNDGNITEK